MSVLIDTNILVRLAQPASPKSSIGERALNVLRDRGELLYISAQNLIEFWAVCTRPLGANGLGMSTEQARHELTGAKRLFRLLPELPLLDQWEELVTAFQVSGRNTHDARLVAAMKVHGIGSILTFNVQDFARYPDISVLDPNLLANAGDQ